MTGTSGNKVASTQADVVRELAKRGIHVTRQQVAKYAKRAERDFVSADDFLEWQRTNEERSPRVLAGNKSLAELREEKLRGEVALLAERLEAQKRENAIQSGRLVVIEEVYAQQDQAVGKARAVLMQKFGTELPPKQDGMPAEKIAELNRRALDEVFAILSKRETYTND